MAKANFQYLRETSEYVLIRDVGPWDLHPTVTNDAENVIARIDPPLGSRRLFYVDSEGDTSEIVVAGGRFAGFALEGPED